MSGMKIEDEQAEASVLRQLAERLVAELRTTRIDAYGADHAETADIMDEAAAVLDNRRAGQEFLERLQQAEFKATILQAQLGGWEAACAAQVRAAQALLDYYQNGLLPDPALDPLLDALHRAIDTNAGELLLKRLETTEIVIGTLREWMDSEVSSSALRIALAQYDAAGKAGQE